MIDALCHRGYTLNIDSFVADDRCTLQPLEFLTGPNFVLFPGVPSLNPLLLEYYRRAGAVLD